MDDILMENSSRDEISEFKEKLNGKFEMKDISIAKRILVMDMVRNRDTNKVVECFE